MKYEVYVVCSSMEMWKREWKKLREWESKFPDFTFFAFSLHSGKSSQSPFVREVLQEPQVDEDFLNEFYQKAELAALCSVHRCSRS